MKMYGMTIDHEPNYEAGHVLTEEEAEALCSLRAENVGHLVRAKAVPLLCEETGQEPNEFKYDDKNPKHVEIAAQLQAWFNEINEGYQFGRKGGGKGRSPMDAVKMEARRLARAAINKQAAEQGIELTKVRRAELVDRYTNDYLKQAKRNVEALEKSAGSIKLDLG